MSSLGAGGPDGSPSSPQLESLGRFKTKCGCWTQSLDLTV